MNQEEGMVGVIQLMNAMDKDNNIIPFDKSFERIILALASHAAILYLEEKISQNEYQEHINRLDEIWDLVQDVNASGFLSDDKYEQLQEIFKLSYQYEDENIPYFTKEEQDDLLIQSGTLTENERKVMKSHVELTETILNKVHFNHHFSQAPRFAVEHHEYLNGMGYPKKLTAEQLSLESRILAVADICDALLATDRPYKKPLPRDKAFAILYDMAESGRIDKKLVQYLDVCI